MRLTYILAAMCAALLAAGPAFADDSALNKEGFWTVGRGDADAKACMASIDAADRMLLVQVAPDHIDFVVGAGKPMSPGRKGVLTIDAERFEFAPAYTDDREILFIEDPGGRALAALRTARRVAVQVDGRELLSVELRGTGLAGALDAVVACSEGKSGWWGPGIGAEKTAEGPVPNKSIDNPVYNKEGAWALAAGEEPGVCVAHAVVDDDLQLQILAGDGQVGLAVGTGGPDLPRGRRGKVETDAYAFDFKPQYGADSYMAADAPFDTQAIFALKRAKWVRIKVDGRVIVDADVEGSGFAEVLDAVAACSRGESGWWGKGAKEP